jgi:deoxycytidine triphosphate deaminase
MTHPEAFAAHSIGAVLTDNEIRRLVDHQAMIEPFEEGSLQGASYDLRMGPKCSTGGLPKTLTPMDPGHQLQPGGFILLLSMEYLKVPIDVVGHTGLISRWAQKGLVSLFSPQIDPGFEGHIIVPLFNAGNDPVTLQYGETMFTVEFVRTTGPASVSWADSHSPIRTIPPRSGLTLARPDLTDVQERVRELGMQLQKLEASMEGFKAGFGQRQTVQGKNAAWWAVGLAVLALGAPGLWRLVGVG